MYFVPARLHHLNSADEESSTDDEGKQADKSPDEENGDTQDAAGEQQPGIQRVDCESLQPFFCIALARE